MHVPRDERGRWNGAGEEALRDNLKMAVGAWYGASSLDRDAFRARFLDPYASDETVDRLRAASRGIVEAQSHDELGAAASDLATVAQKVGSYQWSRFVGDAAQKAVTAVSHGEVPRATLVQAGVASVVSGGTAAASPGTAVLGRVAVRLAASAAAVLTAPELAAVLGAITLTVWIGKNGAVGNVSVQGSVQRTTAWLRSAPR